jgi:flagellar hook-associated protein FlgK
MSLSTFSGLYIAKTGIQASRAGLQITGQNMTNVNTEGYTKQTVDTYSLASAQGNMRIAGANLQIGEGVTCPKTSQCRDPYLDIRYREKNTEAGGATAKRDTLSDIEDVFDETVKQGINTRLADLISQIQTYSQTPTDTSLENTVKTSSSLLANAFNYAAKKLEDARSSTEYSLNTDVLNVNDLLRSIASYNQQIRSAELSGSSALEIKDKLNTAIDELSNCLNIHVEQTTESAGVTTVSRLSISLVNDDGSTQMLVDGGDYNQLVATKNNAGEYTISLSSPLSANILLKKISSLNQQIQAEFTQGNTPTDLINQRTSYLNELQKYVDIDCKTSLDNTSTANDYDVSLVLSDSSKTSLISGTVFNQLATDIDDTTGAVQLYIVDSANNKTSVSSNTSKISSTNFTTGTIGGYCTMLNDEGEFDGTEVRGIGYYQKVLDKLAYEFASIMNKQNSTDSAGTNKPLFESFDPANPTITAANISISNSWENATSAYLTTTKTSTVTGTSANSSDSSNLLSMINALSQEISFTTDVNNATTGKALFKSSVKSYMSTVTNSILALQVKDIQRAKDTADAELDTTETERASVSSVDINEEGINLIKYNQAFSASSRFMTAINEMLETLIDEMGIV